MWKLAWRFETRFSHVLMIQTKANIIQVDSVGFCRIHRRSRSTPRPRSCARLREPPESSSPFERSSGRREYYLYLLIHTRNVTYYIGERARCKRYAVDYSLNNLRIRQIPPESAIDFKRASISLTTRKNLTESSSAHRNLADSGSPFSAAQLT